MHICPEDGVTWSCETLQTIYQTTWRHTREDSNFYRKYYVLRLLFCRSFSTVRNTGCQSSKNSLFFNHFVSCSAVCGRLTVLFIPPVGKEEARTEDNSDEVLSSIGNFGRWQMWVCFWLFIVKFPVAWHALGIVFLAPPVESWCRRPASLQNLTEEQWRNMSQPPVTSGPQGRDSCRMYANNYTTGSYNEPPADRSTVTCQHWEYDRSIFQETIVTQVRFFLRLLWPRRL